MNKILLSLVTISLVSVVAIGATKAYFSDTETSTGNSFTAATLNLTANDHEGTAVEHVTLGDLMPGWKGYDGNGVPNAGLKWKLTNTGSISGNVTLEFVNVHDNDNGVLSQNRQFLIVHVVMIRENWEAICGWLHGKVHQVVLREVGHQDVTLLAQSMVLHGIWEGPLLWVRVRASM